MGEDQHREQRVQASVSCPVCEVPRGQACRLRTAGERAVADGGRLFQHSGRRAAWLEWKRANPVNIYIRGARLYAQSDEAWQALDLLAPAGAERHAESQVVQVAQDQIRPLGLALMTAGWRVE